MILAVLMVPDILFIFSGESNSWFPKLPSDTLVTAFTSRARCPSTIQQNTSPVRYFNKSSAT